MARRFRLLATLSGLAVLASGCGSSANGLFVVNPEGGDARKVFSGCIDLFAWSPDGNSIALIRSSGALEILNLREDRSNVVAEDAGEFTWSPDSSEIAWAHVPFVGFGKGLWVAATTRSSKPRMIWKGQLRSLAWAPNGKQIAFSSVRSLGSRARIALIQPDGSGLTYLTGPIAEGFWQSTVRWFPDSTRLLFVGPVGESISTPLWAVRADGSGLRRLATEPPQSWPPFETSAAISPDGARVAYWVTLDHSGAYGTDPNVGEIFIVNVRGSGKKRYLGHGALGGWSPDGKQLAFAYRGLYVTNATGTTRRKITANATNAQWSSRGQLAYTHRSLPSC